MTTYIAKIGVVFMVLSLCALLLQKKRIQWPMPAKLFLVFWAWAAFSTVLSDIPGDLDALWDLGKIGLVFLVSVNVLVHRLALRFFLLVFAVCFALFPVRGTLLNYYVLNNVDFGRPAWLWLFGNPNDLAALTLLALAIVAGFLHKETPHFIRLPSFAMCFLLPFIILLTQSRGAFLAMCVFILCYISSIGQHRVRAFIVLAAIGAIVVVVAPPAVWDRIGGLQKGTNTETIAEMDPEGSAEERLEIIETAFRIIDDHPFLGVGRGMGRIAQGIYNPKRGNKSFHNTYLEVLAETGAPGFTVFMMLIISLFVQARRARRLAITLKETADWRRLQLIEFGLVAYLVAGIWGTYAYLSLLYIFLAALYAQTVVVNSLANESSRANQTTNPLVSTP